MPFLAVIWSNETFIDAIDMTNASIVFHPLPSYGAGVQADHGSLRSRIQVGQRVRSDDSTLGWIRYLDNSVLILLIANRSRRIHESGDIREVSPGGM